MKPLRLTDEAVESRDVLYTWRRETAEARYGTHIVTVYGSHMIMSDNMIDRVIACAQAGKLHSIQHLINETGWRHDLASQYGESLLAVVHGRYNHPPLKKKITGSNNENANAVPSTSVTTRVMHCSACGQPGHNRKKLFPTYLHLTYSCTTLHQAAQQNVT